MKKILFFITVTSLIHSLANAQVKLSPNARQPVNKNVPVLKQAPALKMPLNITQTLSFTPAAVTRSFFPIEKRSGDNEFGKNELHIEVSINYAGYFGRDSVLKVQIYLYGKEWGGDGSAVSQHWEIPVYTAPAGYVIKSITSQGLSAAFTFDTKDQQRAKIENYSSCYTHVYDLSRASLGFDLHQSMLADLKITTRNTEGPDMSTTEGGISCGFGIRSITFRPVTIVIEKKQ